MSLLLVGVQHMIDLSANLFILGGLKFNIDMCVYIAVVWGKPVLIPKYLGMNRVKIRWSEKLCYSGIMFNMNNELK